MIVEMW